jgi:hypothetical protein
MITLPLESIPATQKNPTLSVIYSQRKIGKTSSLPALGELGKYVILETDKKGKGADFVDCCRYPITKYEDLTEFCSATIKAGRPYQFGILDTVTTFEDLCEEDATRAYKASNAGKKFEGRSVLELVGPDYNPGYRWLRLSFSLAMSKLTDAFPYVILMGHIKDKFINIEKEDKLKKTDVEVSTKELDLSGQIRGMIMTAADAAGFMYRTYSQDPNAPQILRISFKTHDFATAGSRCPHLVQKDFPLDWKEIYKFPL